jgi:hypothetical protein
MANQEDSTDPKTMSDTGKGRIGELVLQMLQDAQKTPAVDLPISKYLDGVPPEDRAKAELAFSTAKLLSMMMRSPLTKPVE